MNILGKETQAEYDLIIQKSTTQKTNKYSAIISLLSTRHGRQHHTGLFSNDALLMSQKYLMACGDKSVHIAALSMAMSHVDKETDIVLHMSALYIFLEAKQPKEVSAVGDYVGVLSNDDKKFVWNWASKVMKNNWNFDDLRKYIIDYIVVDSRYLTASYTGELREKNMNANGFKINITLYML